MRNEEFYIAVLRSIITNKQLDAITKVRPQYQLELALKIVLVRGQQTSSTPQ